MENRKGFAEKVLMSSLNGLYTYDLREGINTFINPQYTKLTGYTLRDLNSMSRAEFFALFHPEDQARVAAHQEEITRSENGDILDIEYRFKTAKGEWIWCLSRDAVFERSDDGNVTQMLGTFLDITERKRMEAELRESEKHFRLLFEQAVDGIAILDTAGRAVDVNTACCQMLGYSREEILSRKFPEVIVEEDVPRIASEVAGLAGGGVTSSEWHFRRKDGSVFVGEVVGRQLPDGRLQGILRDITERKRAEEENEAAIEFLRLVNKSKGIEEIVHDALKFIKEKSGFDAVGIRLREGDDYPYFETRGFTGEFVRLENSLCSRDEEGSPLLDSSGNPVLECMCGTVISGRFDPSKPFFTKRGSFWTNSTTELLFTSTEAERQVRTRNRCNGEGYESVALIPLRVGENNLGLIQLNDKHRGRFTPEMIAFWERLAGYLAVALSKFKAEEALRVSEQSYRNLFEKSVQAIYLHDFEGNILDVNRMAVSQSGYAKEELLMMNVFDLHPDKTGSEDILLQWKGWPLGQSFTFKNKHRGKDGREYPVEITTGKVNMGGRIHIMAHVQDITERVQAEGALRASEERYRLLVEQAVDGIFVSDERGRFLDVNSAGGEMLGYSRDEILNRSISDIIEEDEVHRIAPEVARFEGDRIARSEWRFRRKDGTAFIGEVVGRQLPDGRLQGILRDITERKRSEEALKRAHDELEFRVQERTAELEATNLALGEYAEKLERANQDLKQFAFMASHDLQEPLRKIQMFSDLLRDNQRALPEEKRRDYFERMQFAAERMRTMIDGLLAYSRVTTRGHAFVEIKLSDAARRALQILDLKVEEAGADVEIGELPSAEADPSQIEQLFQNLMENALKFRRKDVPLQIKIYGVPVETGRARIMVADNGIGFEEKHVERIFAPFERLHGTSAYQGTGIGLAICRKIVERHGGTITAKSTPGRGSTFIVDLPVKQTRLE